MARPLSKTPRTHSKPRTVDFTLSMREKMSENWVDVRKGTRPAKAKKKSPKKAAKIVCKKTK